MTTQNDAHEPTTAERLEAIRAHAVALRDAAAAGDDVACDALLSAQNALDDALDDLYEEDDALDDLYEEEDDGGDDPHAAVIPPGPDDTAEY